MLLASGTTGSIGPGAPRQADVRRATSNAYYAVFHALIAAAVERSLGASATAVARGEAGRVFDHAAMREASVNASKVTLPATSIRFYHGVQRPDDLRELGDSFVTLRKRLHDARSDVAMAGRCLGLITGLKADAAFHRYLFNLQSPLRRKE